MIFAKLPNPLKTTDFYDLQFIKQFCGSDAADYMEELIESTNKEEPDAIAKATKFIRQAFQKYRHSRGRYGISFAGGDLIAFHNGEVHVLYASNGNGTHSSAVEESDNAILSMMLMSFFDTGFHTIKDSDFFSKVVVIR